MRPRYHRRRSFIIICFDKFLSVFFAVSISIPVHTSSHFTTGRPEKYVETLRQMRRKELLSAMATSVRPNKKKYYKKASVLKPFKSFLSLIIHPLSLYFTLVAEDKKSYLLLSIPADNSVDNKSHLFHDVS